MTAFKGYVFQKLYAMGTRSEGPMYLLQTYPDNKELTLVKNPREIFQMDKELQTFVGKKAKIEGLLEGSVIEVKKIEETTI